MRKQIHKPLISEAPQGSLIDFILDTRSKQIYCPGVLKVKTLVVSEQESSNLALKVALRHANNRPRVLGRRGCDKYTCPELVGVQRVDESICEVGLLPPVMVVVVVDWGRQVGLTNIETRAIRLVVQSTYRTDTPVLSLLSFLPGPRPPFFLIRGLEFG